MAGNEKMKKMIIAVTVLVGLTSGVYAQSALEQLKKDIPAYIATATKAPTPNATIKAIDATTVQKKPVGYELSRNGVSWSRTPEELWVEEKKTTENTISVKVVLGLNKMGRFTKVAEFNLELLQRARCMDCNEDVYGISNPSNTLFNEFVIKFKGKRIPDGSESGTVSIGKTVFNYRSIFR